MHNVIEKSRLDGGVGDTSCRLTPDSNPCGRVEWMRRADVRRCLGLGKDVLDRMVAGNLVEAHKIIPGRNGTVVFSVDDIRKAIVNSPRYRPFAGED